MDRYKLAKPVCPSALSMSLFSHSEWIVYGRSSKNSLPVIQLYEYWLCGVAHHPLRPMCSVLRQREIRLSPECKDLPTLIPIAKLTTSCRCVHSTALQRSTALLELTLSQDIIPPPIMAGANLKAPVAAVATSSPSSPKATNTKWNEEAHRALIGTLLDVMDSADMKWRAHLDLMVENLAERGQQFSREGIR